MRSFKVWGWLATVGLLSSQPALAQDSTHEMSADHRVSFRSIEQPLPLKVVVALVGLSVIGAELHWFLNKKPRK